MALILLRKSLLCIIYYCSNYYLLLLLSSCCCAWYTVVWKSHLICCESLWSVNSCTHSLKQVSISTTHLPSTETKQHRYIIREVNNNNYYSSFSLLLPSLSISICNIFMIWYLFYIEELWKNMCLDAFEGDFQFQGTWRSTFVEVIQPTIILIMIMIMITIHYPTNILNL